jgi:hypothetical protein
MRGGKGIGMAGLRDGRRELREVRRSEWFGRLEYFIWTCNAR